LVEEIKEKTAIFGKEIFEDESYTWKVNAPQPPKGGVM
jgi:molybdopterin synthase catalytic subunit